MKLRKRLIPFEASMATTIEIEPTVEAVIQAIKETFPNIPVVVTDKTVHVIPYGYDGKSGWNTYSVSIDDWGVYGFTDGPLQEYPGEALKVGYRIWSPVYKEWCKVSNIDFIRGLVCADTSSEEEVFIKNGIEKLAQDTEHHQVDVSEPRIVTQAGNVYRCPNCTVFVWVDTNYCHSCGVKLRWA